MLSCTDATVKHGDEREPTAGEERGVSRLSRDNSRWLGYAEHVSTQLEVSVQFSERVRIGICRPNFGQQQFLSGLGSPKFEAAVGWNLDFGGSGRLGVFATAARR